MALRIPVLFPLVCLITLSLSAQDTSQMERAWRPLLLHEGVEFKFLFYPMANAQYNGVVLRLHNQNGYPVRYRFNIVFQSGDEEKVEPVEGMLEAGERRTGDQDGLFWIPFTDGRMISQVGLRSYNVEQADHPAN